MKKTMWYSLIILALLSLFVGTGAVLAAQVAVSEQTSAAAPLANQTINQVDTSYNPTSVTLNVGESVTWNAAFGAHPLRQVTGPTSDTPVSGGFSYNGSDPSFTHMFPTAGTFYFQCTVHGTSGNSMRGEVRVIDPNATPNTPTATATSTSVSTSTPTSTRTPIPTVAPTVPVGTVTPTSSQKSIFLPNIRR